MPHVAALAKRLLAAPSSTADLERVFKVAKLLSTSERRSLDLERMVRLRANTGRTAPEKDADTADERTDEEEEEEEEKKEEKASLK